MAKCCKTPPELNSLGRMWYCVFVVCTFLYLLIDAVKRYTYYNTTEWPEDGKPSTQLTFYIILITISLLAILAFVPTQILQIGNAPNDDKKLGKKQHEKKFDMGYDARKGPGRARRMLKHVGPVGATLHVFSAFCLLLPILLLQSAEIEQSRLPAEAIWSTELDFIFGSSYKSVALVTDFEAMSTPVPTAAKEVTAYNFYANPSVSIAFLNYLIPLFLYAVRFADIFSITHRLFSVIFATELVLIAINKALTYCGFSVLYKLDQYGWEKSGIVGEPMLHGVGVITFLYIASSVIIFLFAMVLYLYAHGQLHGSFKKLQDKEHPADLQTTSSIAFNCNGFLSHILALVALGTFLAFRVPMMIEYYKAYCDSGCGIMLTCLVYDILFIIQWVVLWLVFTLKKDWKFTTSYIYDRPIVTGSQYSTMKKEGGSPSLSRLIGDGVEMTVVNSGTRHAVKNVAKQEAIMRAMKQLQSTEDTGSLDRRMQKNPLHKSQDSLNRERDTLKKQSPKVQSAHTAGTLPKASPALPAKKSDSKRNSLASASSKDAEIQG